MEVIIQPDYEQVCREAAAIIREAWERKHDLVLGFATGKSPLGLYQKLIDFAKKGEMDFSSIAAFNLDEYLGLGETHPQSFAHYMDQNLFRQINIRKENIHRLDGRAGDIEEHCRAYEEKIKNAGGIDIQILGIGKNGHIAFNEPGSALSSRTRLKILTRETVEANRPLFKDERDMPRFCLTMGIGTILETKTVLLLAAGKDKAEIVARAIEGPVTAAVPASALQFHARAKFIIDGAAASELANAPYYRWAYENKDRVSDLFEVMPLKSKK
jgi:glucosamine-6-phosphate deaminase